MSSEHPVGDFVFTRFTWTSQDQDKYARTGSPPLTISDLPGLKAVLPVCYYSRDLECTFMGPELTQANFRRLNSCRQNRLVVWNLTGADDLDRPSLAVVPSEDIGPTAGQRTKLSKKVNKKQEFSERMPTISSTFNTGLYASDYAVGPAGPLAYSGGEWDDIWELLDRFTREPTVQHPEGRPRNTASYMQPLWQTHKRLVQEDDRDLEEPRDAVGL